MTVLGRLTVIGDEAVGKTQMIVRYTGNTFTTRGQTTKLLQIDDTNYKIQIWDTAGQQAFRTLVETYYRHAMASSSFTTSRGGRHSTT
jgi:small GTP-binding protein